MMSVLEGPGDRLNTAQLFHHSLAQFCHEATSRSCVIALGIFASILFPREDVQMASQHHSRHFAVAGAQPVKPLR
jgi:hypothetical protein